MRFAIVFGAVLLVASSTIPSSARADGAEGDSIRGARLYSANCGRCHNPRAPIEHRDRDWSIIITHMRIAAGLPGQQARDVYAFMTASNIPPRPEFTRTAAVVGPVSGDQMLDQYGCRGCHTIGGVGGTVGPNLQGVFERRDEDWIRAQIQHPREHNPRTVMPEFGFTDAQVDVLVETLKGAQ